jgi:hypothetical protein
VAVFPSSHTALAVLGIVAARPLRILKIPLRALKSAHHLVLTVLTRRGSALFYRYHAGIILAALTISLTGS